MLRHLVKFGILIFAVYIAISFHPTRFTRNKDLENLYEGLRNAETSEKSFEGLIKYGPDAGNFLAGKLSAEKDNLIKGDAIQILGFVGCEGCLEKVLPFLDDTDWRIRFFTIDTLDKLKYKDISCYLYKIISKDSDNRVRNKAIMTLGKYGDEKDIAFLKELANREGFNNPNLIKAINIALAQLNKREFRKEINEQ
jgi:HEAT repeat protein